MTIRWIRSLLPAALALAAAGCAGMGPSAGTIPGPSLLPDYRNALAAQPQDVIAYFREWCGALTPAEDESGRIAYTLEGDQADVMGAVERLMAGYEAHCAQRSGTLAEPGQMPGRRCIGSDGATLAGLEVDVVHAAEFQPGRLRFAAETGERIQRMAALRRIQHAQVMQTLRENGPSGSVLLTSGEAFDAARFGRLSAPDYYAVQVPGRYLIPLADTLSVRWTGEDVRIVMRDGSVVTDTGKEVAPARSLVRLVPSGNDSVDVAGMTFDAPFRFVTLDGKARQPRQVRLRDVAQILEITVSPRAPALRAGALSVRPNARDQAAFNLGLVNDAKRAAKTLKVEPPPIDVTDARMRADLQRMGRNGPCSRSQSDAALQRGDLSLSEFYVCAQYRRESKALLANDGAISTEKTPLVFLGQAARAPWFDFGGVLR
jgi:hypothetical protein